MLRGILALLGLALLVVPEAIGASGAPATPVPAPTQTGWKTFRNATLGIEFSYPPNRRVKAGCRGSQRCVALVGPGMRGSDYLIAFEVFPGSLEKVAVEDAVFVKTDRGWTAKGRSGEYPAMPLTGPRWKGLKATVDCGVSDSRGFHAAAGECLWAVVSDGRRSVVVDSQGLVGNDAASMRSIQSLRFRK
jgi:hypothetical protein